MYIKLFITILIITLQTSCTGKLSDLVQRESEIDFRKDFNAYLAREYLQYSRMLKDKKSFSNANYFATKGLKSSSNEEVFPEFPDFWNLDMVEIEEAFTARQRIQMLLNTKTKRTLPIQLAHLIMLYDCWLSSGESQDFSIPAVSKCKARFFNLLDEVEEFMANLKVKKEVKVIEINEPKFRKFDIFFDFNTTQFNNDAKGKMIEVIDHLESLNGNFRILLSGNSDRKGKNIYNDSLARKRVLAVKTSLIKNGAPEDVIEYDSTGERNPQIVTSNNKRNKYNRLVSVYVLEGRDSLQQIPLPLIDNYIYKKEIEEIKRRKRLQNDVSAK